MIKFHKGTRHEGAKPDKTFKLCVLGKRNGSLKPSALVTNQARHDSEILTHHFMSIRCWPALVVVSERCQTPGMADGTFQEPLLSGLLPIAHSQSLTNFASSASHMSSRNDTSSMCPIPAGLLPGGYKPVMRNSL